MDTTNFWVESTVATGGGVSNTQTETAGTISFTGTGLSMYYNIQNSASVTVTRIDTTPNIYQAGPDTVLINHYWVVNRFGTGTFEADLTFVLEEDLTTNDQNNPEIIKLYTRPSNADTNWAFLASASSVDTLNDNVTFAGIGGFGQFIISKPTSMHLTPEHMYEPAISVFPNPTNGLIYIKMNEINCRLPVYLEVYNSVGTIIRSKILIKNGDYTVDLSFCAAGLYFLKFQYCDKILMKKIVKHK